MTCPKGLVLDMFKGDLCQALIGQICLKKVERRLLGDARQDQSQTYWFSAYNKRHLC